MTEPQLIDTKIYVVGGTSNNSKFSYLGFDSASGGYPCVSDVPRDLTSDVQQATKWLADAKKNLKRLENVKIYEIMLQEVIVEKEPESEKISELFTPEFLRKFVVQQSCGEWSDRDIQEDSVKLSRFIQAAIVNLRK